MRDINSNLLLEVALDLANSINNDDRFDRLLSSIRKAINCDAVALLGFHHQVLTPLAIQGLSRDTLGRRFVVTEHPRLALICGSGKPLRFAADSDLPDPYDGLLLARQGNLPVHSCMGLPLYSDQQLIGVVTLDSLQPGKFDDLDERILELIAALSAATLKTALELNQLQSRARMAQNLVKELTQEALLRDGGELIGQSPAMLSLKSDIQLVAGSDYSVLILGETGVGKELVARTVHHLSARQDKTLVHLNCASLPETLAESELFGHVKGAFTGADRERQGKFQLADGGTIFLDEVGELSLTVQSKLLRVLQSGEIQPVGKDQVQHVDVRVIAATNRDLSHEVREGRFRADLYHRLSVYPLKVPALAQRQDDVLLLAGYFLEQTCRKLGYRQLKLSPAASDRLMAYNWPGNVRELEHVISRAALKAQRDFAQADIIALSAELLDIQDEPTATAAPTKFVHPERKIKLKTAVDDYQKNLIIDALNDHQGNWSEAARQLDLDRGNLVRLAKRLGIYQKKQLAGLSSKN